MPERYKQALRLACLVLAALIIYELADVVVRINPLARVRIPDLPSLPPDTNAPPAVKRTNAAEVATSGSGTDNPPRRGGTNSAASTNLAGTNVVSPAVSTNTGTNVPPPTVVAGGGTNPPAMNVVLELAKTNQVTAVAGTNSAASVGTNAAMPGAAPGVGGSAAGVRPLVLAGGPNGGPRMAGGRPGVELPAAIQARVDRIADSEILGAVIHPPPMALLGIAGKYAFIRTSTGQTGMVKEGEEFGGLKLLIAGTNRVLVEEQGQKKELTIYSGFGGESLLPKPETTNEIIKRQ